MRSAVRDWEEMGNGALPFPARRVEMIYPSKELLGDVYEVREYLGNETVVAYREVFTTALQEWIPVEERWAIVRSKLAYYIMNGEDR